MRLSKLHEEFIDMARRPMSFGSVPVLPREKDVPIIATNKWEIVDSPRRLRKSFEFLGQPMRNDFVKGILSYEDDCGHNAIVTIDENKVTLDIRTKDIDQITELDKEYAKYVDLLYKDVVYGHDRHGAK